MKRALFFILLLITSNGQAQSNDQTIGIGLIVDSISNISNQYSVYELLQNNPLHTKDGIKLTPVLTLRRGTTDYYINGKLNNNMAVCNLFYQGKLQARFRISLPKDDWDGIQKQFYKELSLKLGNTKDASKGVNTVSLNNRKFGETGGQHSIEYQILAQAENFLPPIQNDSIEKWKQYYMAISGKEDMMNAMKAMESGGKYQKMGAKMEEKELNRSAGQVFNLLSKPSGDLPMKYLQNIFSIYNATNTNYFFFNSGYIDEQIKTQIKPVVLPYYKRPGTVMTYLQCGWEFAMQNQHESAIECFNSGLLMVDRLNTLFKFRESLKQSLFYGLSKEYSRNNQGSSSYVCSKLGDLHHSIESSMLLRSDDSKLQILTINIVGYLTQVVLSASFAKMEAGFAIADGVKSAVASASSAINDGLHGSTTISSQTQTYMDQASTMLIQSSDMKSASQSSTAKAGEVFKETYGEIINQINAENGTEVNRPFFAYDLVQILANKKLALEQISAVLKFANSIPAIEPEFERYYLDIDNDELTATNIVAIYHKMASIEFKIFSIEASGNPTDKELVFNYK